MQASNPLLIMNFLDYLKYECRAEGDVIADHEKSVAHLAAWLRADDLSLPDATRITLQLYIGDSLSQGTSARRMARRLSHLRLFYGFLILEKQIKDDPTFCLAMPKHCARTKGKHSASATVVTWVRRDWDAHCL